ncbi:MAG TPA: hypothetical protein VJ924_04515 [Alphaproteobacteria bacterium]|nr:hypothetical protein [Alphaproteobacteria bacterium]
MPAADRPFPTYCFSVFAAAEASVMPRVLELFAKRGLVPCRFEAVRGSSGLGGPGDELAVDLQVEGLAPETADHIAQCLRQMVYVDRVLTAIKVSRPVEAGDRNRLAETRQ